MKIYITTAALLAISACTPVAVSEFNGESVKIQSPDDDYDAVEVQAEAKRLCAIKGKTSQYASSTERYEPQYISETWDHLFICV